MGMNGGYTEADFEEDGANIDTSIKCKRCGGFGHKTASSSKCKHYKPRKKKAKPTAGDAASTADVRDRDECAKLDAMPFDTPMPNDDEDDEDFFDAFEFETANI